MAELIQKTCVNHTGRRAIGVCIVTSQPICAECSTRYRGVNYSKQGLEILKQQREATSLTGGRAKLIRLSAVVLSPILLCSMFLFFLLFVRYLMLVSYDMG